MKKGVSFNSLNIKEDKEIVICREIIEIKYDLNWFYLRTIILSYKHIPISLWNKYVKWFNKTINHKSISFKELGIEVINNE